MATTNELLPLAEHSEIVHDYSRFFRQSVYRESGEMFWGTWIPPEIPFSPQDVYHEVAEKDERRLDLISYRWYKTPELWWVIAEANNLMFPVDDLEIGMILRIPNKVTLRTLGILQ